MISGRAAFRLIPDLSVVVARLYHWAMADKSAIEWTEATWNPTTGCDRTSPGCDNCYALTLSKRLKAMGSAKYQNDGDPRTSGPGFKLTIHPSSLDIPKRWERTPARLRELDE